MYKLYCTVRFKPGYKKMEVKISSNILGPVPVSFGTLDVLTLLSIPSLYYYPRIEIKNSGEKINFYFFSDFLVSVSVNSGTMVRNVLIVLSILAA